MGTKPPQSKPLAPLKTPMAWGIDGKRIFAKDITRENVARIKSKLPRDFDGNRVEPNVGNDDTRAHFFIEGERFSGNGLRRNESSERHAYALRTLLQHLKNARSKIDVFTGGPVNPKTQWRNEVFKFSLLDGCKYQWVDDPETRIWMNQEDYLQPDIAGRDIKRFAASPRYPWIIVEVVHHHWPDPKTWDALVELSKRNHFVAFYCVTETHLVWQMNAYTVNVSNRMRLRVQLYLQDGVLYDGEEAIPIYGDNAIERQKSAHGYLTRAREKYLLEQEKKDEYKASKKKEVDEKMKREAEGRKGSV